MSILDGFVWDYVLLWITVFLCFRTFALWKRRRYNLPPGPRGLPFVGILPFLGRHPHLQLCKWSEKYGDVFSFYLGRTFVVAITDVAIAKGVLSKTSTAHRPENLFGIITDGGGFGENNGTNWTEQRKFAMTEMKNLGLGKSEWETLVKMEATDLVNEIMKFEGQPRDIKRMLFTSTSNNIITFVSNHRLPVGDPKRDIIEHGVESFHKLSSQSGLFVCLPKLVFKLAVKFGLLNIQKEIKDMNNMNKYIRQEINESRERGEEDTFICKYLNEIEKNKQKDFKNGFNERNLLGNVQAFFVGGSHTTYVVIHWLLLAMAAFPEKQKKVHEEVERELGKDGSTDWNDHQKFPYCLATTMEGQRWRTIGPLNLLHWANKDIIINGYDVPKGTNIMAPLWAYHCVNRYWENPDEFQPERFLSEDGQTIREHKAYVPFGFGKRMCPGKNIADIQLFHYFVGIMQKFRVLPESETKLPDLEGLLGLTLQPKKQLLRFIPR